MDEFTNWTIPNGPRPSDSRYADADGKSHRIEKQTYRAGRFTFITGVTITLK